MEGIFSTGYERRLLEQNLKAVSAFLEHYNKPKPKILGLISLPELKDDLKISYNTIQRWENAGLKRYEPPVEDGRTVFYKITDVLIFLGVDHV
ncbi:hypothetical protein ABPH35_10260 [Streptococcus sp. ZJ93]|uniref:hypothetical protein n=1 Tax=Streptococcus handemini TaxID=3161188 RepID=UPI0034D49751